MRGQLKIFYLKRLTMRTKFTLSHLRFTQRPLCLIAASTLPDLCFYGVNKWDKQKISTIGAPMPLGFDLAVYHRPKIYQIDGGYRR